MNLDELRAKCVFGQMTLEDAFGLFNLGDASGVRVVMPQRDRHWDYDYCKYAKADRRLLGIYGGNDPDPSFLFSLDSLVEIKSDYILVEGIDDCAGTIYELHFFEKRPLSFDLGKVIRS